MFSLQGLVDLAAIAVESLRDGLPFLGHGHDSTGIQYSIAKEMIELQTDTVHLPLEVTLAVVQGVTLGCEDR